MFVVTWIPINTNTLIADIGQSWLDIVGNSDFPALFYALEGSDVYFRIRLDDDPLAPPIKDRLRENVWGVVIKDTSFNPQYTVRVNPKNNNEKVQVYTANGTLPFVTLSCEQPIVYGDLGNVRVIEAQDGSEFSSNLDYFLDFKVPLTCFPVNFFTQSHIFCGFTATDDVGINKEIPPPYGQGNPPNNNPALCGGTPAVLPMIEIVKDVIPKIGATCSSEAETYTITISVKNISTQVLDISLIDIITDEFIPTIPIPTVFPVTAMLSPEGIVTVNYSVTGFFLNPGDISFNTAIVTSTVSGIELGRAVGPIIKVTKCRGLFFS